MCVCKIVCRPRWNRNEIQWIHSYVTDAKIYCVYTAPSKDLIQRHADESGFPANRISEVRAMIDPTRAA